MDCVPGRTEVVVGGNSSENALYVNLAAFTAHTAYYCCHVGSRTGLPHVAIEAWRW